MTQGAVSFAPLTHTKETGARARLSGRLDNAVEAGKRSLTFSYEEEGETPIVGRADFDGPSLSRITMPVFDLGDMKNVDFGVTEMGGYRQVALRAKKFLINDPIASAFGNSSSSGRLFADSIDAILGKDFSIESQIDTLYGSHEERLDGFRLIINAADGRYERMQVQGSFADGSELVGDLTRISPNRRSFSLQAENGSNVIRLLGFLPDLDGGALLMQGAFYDDGVAANGKPQDIGGRLEMQSFRARKVPVLATEATAMCHGRDAAQKAEATARETFEGGGKSADLPSVSLGTGQLDTGIGLLEAFVLAGLAGSNGEARRLVQGGGARINDAAQNDIARTLTQSDLKDGVIKLSAGKKRHVLLVPEG